jgi:hypothetical protein
MSDLALSDSNVALLILGAWTLGILNFRLLVIGFLMKVIRRVTPREYTIRTAFKGRFKLDSLGEIFFILNIR